MLYYVNETPLNTMLHGFGNPGAQEYIQNMEMTVGMW
jgi:hypothetical protein